MLCRKLVPIAILTLLVTGTLSARKKETWTLLLPREAMRDREGATGSVYEARLVLDEEGSVRLDDAPWVGEHFPSFLQLELDKIRYSRRKNESTVYFSSSKLALQGPLDPRIGRFRGSVYLDFVGLDVAQTREALLQVAIPGPLIQAEAEGRVQGFYEEMAEAAYASSLHSQPIEARVAFLSALHLLDGVPPIERSVKGGRAYLSVRLNEVDQDIPSDTPSEDRVLDALSSYVLPSLEIAAHPLGLFEGVHGLELEVRLRDPDGAVFFSSGYDLQIRLPADGLRAFVEDRITVNDLLRQSAITLDRAPIAVLFPYAE